MSGGSSTLAAPGPQSRTGVPAAWPLLAVALLVVSGAAAFVLVQLDRLPSAAAWIAAPVALIIVGVACRRTALATGPPATRRFWWHWALGAWVMAAAVVLDGLHMVTTDEPALRTGVPAAVLYVLAALIPCWAVVRLSLADRPIREWLTFGLDSAVVVVAAALLGWYVVFGVGGVGAARGPEFVQQVCFLTLSLLIAQMLLKLIIAGDGVLDQRAMWLLVGAVLLEAVIGSYAPETVFRDDTVLMLLTLPVTELLVVLAAARQLAVLTDPAVRHGRRFEHRFTSALPYAAVTAVCALLLAVTMKSEPLVRLVVLSTVMIFAMVLLRQLLSARQNADLVRRLDTSVHELGVTEQRFRSMVQNSSDVIAISEPDGTLTYLSPSLERILGAPVERWTGHSMLEFIHPEDVAVLRAMTAQLLREPERVASAQARVLHADGSWRWLEIVSANRLGDPAIRGLVSNARDITEKRAFQDELAHQATHDSLTRLSNRSLYIERATDALTEDGSAGVVLALVDLDDFKVINDRLGHAVGDELLTAVAGRLVSRVRPDDMVARLGGDEFAVLLADITADEAEQVVARVNAALESPISAGGHDLLVRASVGVATGTPGMDATELLRRADLAMYAVKERGKSGCMNYDESMDARSEEHARLGAELQQALAGGELYLTYQPVVTLPEGGLAGVETLVRWRHPVRGLVSPAEFIPVAERSGLIIEIGAWVLREACRQMAEWRRRFPETSSFMLSVNVSARQLREPRLVRTVADILEETGLNPADVMLEITETAVFDGGPALDTVHALRGLGVRIALDDFGTGHSSLGLLRTCPVDTLKVDKSFVDGVAGSVEEAAVATSIAQIARALGLRSVAEGVETEAQARRLHQLGYRLAQGYYFARPLLPADIDELLASRPDAQERSLLQR